MEMSFYLVMKNTSSINKDLKKFKKCRRSYSKLIEPREKTTRNRTGRFALEILSNGRILSSRRRPRANPATCIRVSRANVAGS